MRFILVRHTETVGNAEHRFNGLTESPYTEKGLKMNDVLTDELAALHAKHPIDRIYASPITRAKHIGELAAEKLNVPLTIADQLIEFNFGIFDGLTHAEAMAKDGELWSRWMSDYNHVRLTDGDQYDVFHNALGDWLQTFDLASDQTVVMISHGGTLHSLLLNLLDLPMGVKWHFHLDLGGIMIVDTPEGYGILKAMYSPNYEDC